MKNFAEELRLIILDEIANDKLSIEVKSFEKNNSTKYTGLVFKLEGDDMAPIIYIDSFYKDYINEDNINIDDIAKQVIDIYFESQVQRKSFNMGNNSFDIRDLLDYEKVKDRLIVTAVNTERNEEMLKSHPHTEFGDISFIARIEVSSNVPGVSTVKVNNEILNYLDVSEEELMNQAWKSMKKMHPAICKDSVDVLKEMHPDLPDFFTDSLEERRGEMYTLLTDNNFNGAAYGFDKETLYGVCDKLNKNTIIIIPSSINEVIICPADKVDEPERLSEIINQVNTESVRSEEVLSNNAYMYDSRTNELTMVNEYSMDPSVYYEEDYDIEDDDIEL